MATWLAVRPRSHPPLLVRVGQRMVRVEPGTTFGQLVSLLDLRPRRGNLLDVEGDVMQANAFPGRLLLNGSPAPAGTGLESADHVDVVAGRNRRERLTEQVVREPAGEPADPQFFLARTPGSEVIVRGARSHKLVSARFRPSGGARVERAVALTFDDGPSPIYTPRVLATLERLHVHATFFVIGYLAAEYPDLVRREERAGMVVGNHSYNHPEVPPFDQLPRQLLADEISLASRALAAAGARPRLFRPPGGSVSALVVRAARELGERVVLWSVDPADWQAGARAKQIARNVLAAIRPGSIVILHDGGGDRSATVAALPTIVKGIRRKGFRLVAIAP